MSGLRRRGRDAKPIFGRAAAAAAAASVEEKDLRVSCIRFREAVMSRGGKAQGCGTVVQYEQRERAGQRHEGDQHEDRRVRIAIDKIARSAAETAGRSAAGYAG